eukprot:1493683-Amphidinium_carterae.1
MPGCFVLGASARLLHEWIRLADHVPLLLEDTGPAAVPHAMVALPLPDDLPLVGLPERDQKLTSVRARLLVVLQHQGEKKKEEQVSVATVGYKQIGSRGGSPTIKRALGFGTPDRRLPFIQVASASNGSK